MPCSSTAASGCCCTSRISGTNTHAAKIRTHTLALIDVLSLNAAHTTTQTKKVSLLLSSWSLPMRVVCLCVT